MRVEVCGFSREEERTWDEYVHRSAGASHSHLIGWRRVIQESYGHRPLYLWAREGDRIRGVMPLVLFRSLVGGRSLVSVPFLDDGGICADDDCAARELATEALRLFEHHRARCLDLRHREPNSLGFPRHGSKVTLILELGPEAGSMWDRFDGKLRNQIRKAMGSGLTASWGGLEDVDAFYEVFATNMRDLGSPVHRLRFFAGVLREFADSARLVLVRKGHAVVGGGVCLFFGSTLTVPWASSLRQYRSLCPNNLLYWEVIRTGCEKGYARLDFGRSSPGSGTYRFKQQWGTAEKALVWQSVARRHGGGSLVESDDVRYRWLVRLWQRLPVPVSKWVGPAVRGNLSN